MLLAGDVGGTKTRLAVFTSEAGPRHPIAEAVFPSRDFPYFEALVAEFLRRVGVTVDRASFGVPGPVIDGRAEPTNLPWTLEETDLRIRLGMRSVRLLNDLEALAHAVPLLGPDDLHTLHPGAGSHGGTVAVIAPGTGLGEAFLTSDGRGHQAHPSEGGHTDFAPQDETQDALLAWSRARWGHVSYERVCSGLGITNVYAHLREVGYAPELPHVAAAVAEAADPTPVIVHAALEEPPSPLCAATLAVFVDVLGAEAGNLALKTLALGGVFLGGGIPPRILPLLEGGRFLRAFLDKGRLSEVLARVPVHVITNPAATLLGAACHAWAMDKEEA